MKIHFPFLFQVIKFPYSKQAENQKIQRNCFAIASVSLSF